MKFLNEFIGFLIVLLIIFAPMLRRLFSKKAVAQIREKPVQEAEYREKRKEAKKSTQPIREKKEARKGVHENFQFHNKMEEYRQKTSFDQYLLESRVKPSYNKEIVSKDLLVTPHTKRMIRHPHLHFFLRKNFTDYQKMVIFHEILSKPKSLRHSEDEY